jgi:anti-sigma factor RsiW
MNCARFQVAIHAWYRGALAPAEHAEVERHAAECAACGALKVACEETACRELVESLPDLVDDALPAERRAALDRHLALCPDCTAYLNAYRATLELTAQAFEEGHTEELPEELVQAILAARRAAGSG